MARATPLAWPPLLLCLLSLFWAPSGAGTKTIGVLAPAQVRGFLGGTTELPCKLQPLGHNVTVTQVTWTRPKLAEAVRSVAVFHPIQGPSFQEPGRLEFVAARPGEELRDASLAVRGLRAEDEGNYTCQFATFPNGDRSARTWLRVLAQPQNEAGTQEIPLSQLSLEPVPVAHCISTGGRPPARISWSPPLDKMANTSQMPGPLPGTVTVISLLTLMPSSHVDGKNVTCRVEHESFKEPLVLPVTLTVPYPPEVSISGYDGNWYIGRSEASLHCDVRSKPEPTGYNWNTGPAVLSLNPRDPHSPGTVCTMARPGLKISWAAGAAIICPGTQPRGTELCKCHGAERSRLSISVDSHSRLSTVGRRNCRSKVFNWY
ncbi:poliovirus receptor isoform X3 [Kogia breviceps]|uniref:poliovirus receptor isoform X3 n=1 Tax=Kogia breviceps TaxID=27615 RepID=UPI0034D33DF4